MQQTTVQCKYWLSGIIDCRALTKNESLGEQLTAEALHPGNTLNEASAPQDGIALLQLLALQ